MIKSSIFSVVSLFICIVLFFFLFKSCKNGKGLKQSEQIAIHQFDSTGYYRDLYNNEHAKTISLLGDKEIIISFFGKKLDSVCNELDINKKQIKSITNSSVEIKERITTKTNYVHDTTILNNDLGLINWSGYYFSWNDTFTTINGYVDSFNTHVIYNVNVPLTYTKYWRRKHKFLGIKFGRKIYYLDAFSENKCVHIKNLKDIQIN